MATAIGDSDVISEINKLKDGVVGPGAKASDGSSNYFEAACAQWVKAQESVHPAQTQKFEKWYGNVASSGSAENPPPLSTLAILQASARLTG